jgi:hypothetical protein
MGKDRRFEPELAANLARRLGLAVPNPQAVAAFERVSEEFYQWVVGNPQESQQQGLAVTPDGDVLLDCPAAKPVLRPLGN